MGKKKRRVIQHIMEEDSMKLLRDLLPKAWVIHEYKPDYGIDVAVEVFQFLEENDEVAETLGESFFVQLKSIKETKIETIRVYSRQNVEKFTYTPDPNKFCDIEVIKFNIDTVDLNTVRAIGPGTPVLLVLVSLDLGRAFFVCLNDLVDKVILPEAPDFTEQVTKVVSIPTANEIGPEPQHLVPLRFYAKRSKMLAAFNKFEFERNELSYLGDNYMEYRRHVAHFLKVLMSLDIWHDCEMWPIISYYYDRLRSLEELTSKLGDIVLPSFRPQCEQIWNGLVSLGHNFEECCREWCLPTYFAQSFSRADGASAAKADTPIKAAKLFYK